MSMPPDYKFTNELYGGVDDSDPLDELPDYGVCNTCQYLDENGYCHNPKWRVGKHGMKLKIYRHKKCKGYKQAVYIDDRDGDHDF